MESKENALNRLETIISRSVPDFFKRNYRLDDYLYKGFIKSVHDETERIKAKFTNAVTDLDTKREIEKYIQFHEYEILRLSGLLINYVHPREINTIKKKLDMALLCQQLYLSLEELLAFAGKHFSQYFDREAWLPSNYRLIIYYEIRKDINTIQKGLAKRGIDADLIGMSLFAFRQFMKDRYSTYRRVLYLKRLQEELVRLINEPPLISKQNPNEPLYWLLLKINFNEISYFNHCTTAINQYINDSDNITERTKKLALLLKQIQQYPTLQDFAYDPSQAPLKEQLSGWILEELKYLRQDQLYLENRYETEIDQNFKFKVALSVPQVAYLLRVFVELEIIQNKPVALLFRLLGKYLQTKRTELASKNSFENHYYNVETATKEAVKKILLKMLNHINN